MSSSWRESLRARTPFGLKAVDGGRLQGVGAGKREDFAGCRLPEEARAGWLIYAGYAAQGHGVAQDLHTAEGEYWHAIYHRLEPDAWNAKYWLRQVGQHAIHEELARRAAELGYGEGKTWDGAKFVDFVEGARGTGREGLAERVQLVEWELLFGYCTGEELG